MTSFSGFYGAAVSSVALVPYQITFTNRLDDEQLAEQFRS